MRSLLLSIHILSVIVWLGCGLYELFLARELKRVRGSELELNLLRIYLRYSAPVPVATILVAVTGLAMTLVYDWGFFQQFWLGTKQALMIAVLAFFASTVPGFIRIQQDVELLGGDAVQVPGATAQLFYRLEPRLIAMRVMGVIAVVLAIAKPG